MLTTWLNLHYYNFYNSINDYYKIINKVAQFKMIMPFHACEMAKKEKKNKLKKDDNNKII